MAASRMALTSISLIVDIQSPKLIKNRVQPLVFDSQVFQIHRFRSHRTQKSSHVIADIIRDVGFESWIDHPIKSEYIILMLGNGFCVDCLACFFSPGDVEPCPRLEGDKVLRTDDGDVFDGSFSGIQKGLVGFIHEYGRQARDFIIDRDGGQVGALNRIKHIRLS